MRILPRNRIKYLTNRILNSYPEAKIFLIKKKNGKHYMKIIVPTQNMEARSSLSSSPNKWKWKNPVVKEVEIS